MFVRETHPGERSNVLKRSSLRSSGGNDDGVLHGIVLLEGLDELGDSGTLLSNSNVDTVQLLALVVGVVPSLLVKHGVKSDGSLSGLTITNDQLTLTTANGDHGVDTLETGLYGLVDGVARQNARSLELSTSLLGGLDWALSINGVTQSINDTTQKFGTNGDINLNSEELEICNAQFDDKEILFYTYNLASSLDSFALLDETIRTEKHNTDLAGFQVHAHALDARGKPKSLVCKYICFYLLNGLVRQRTYSTSSSAWTLAMPWTRAIPSLFIELVSTHLSNIVFVCAGSQLTVRNVLFFIYIYIYIFLYPSCWICLGSVLGVPNGENTASLGKASFFSDTTDFLFENGGDFGRGSLCLSSVCSDLFGSG